MILVLISLVGVGASYYFIKKCLEEVVPCILMITFVLLAGVPLFVSLFVSNAVQYEDYTESYSLQQMSDGNYYSISDDKITVIIINGNIQKLKIFPTKIVSFVNGNTASIQIQGKRSSNDDLFKILFFSEIKDEEKEIIENVIISIPEHKLPQLNYSVHPAELQLKKQISFVPAAGRNLNQNNKKRGCRFND